MTALGDFLATGAHRRRQAGVWDCCTLPADWALACGHGDPMAKWRGTYSTEAEAETLISDAARRGEGLGRSGLEMLFAEGMWGARVPEIDLAPGFAAGDIGLVRVLDEEAGALFTGQRWALVADRGMAFVSLEPECIIRAWRPRAHG